MRAGTSLTGLGRYNENVVIHAFRRLGVDPPTKVFEVVPLQEIICCSLHDSYFEVKRKEVKGEEASASIRLGASFAK